jgi:hypothetical protein
VDAEAKNGFDIRLRFRIDRSIRSERVATQLKREAEAIWGAYGIQLEWTDGDTSDPSPSGVSLDVTVQRGAGVASIEQSPILGRTVVTSDTRSWRPIRVSFDAVEKILSDRMLSRVSGGAMVMEPELARALGRVLAHEIGHVLINTADHDQAGLMRASFSADELAQPDRTPFQLTCRAINQLNDRLHALTGRSPVPAPDDFASCMTIRQ